tara:strand:+ start:675 stop:2009 length:1335 start_codon:yes stop_codon:yes gene_type:complete
MFKILNNKNIKRLFLILLSIFFIELLSKFYWYQPNYSGDWITHLHYLKAVTFNLILENNTWPEWVYAPWHYFISAYLFGPIIYLLKVLNFHNLNNPGFSSMYIFLISILFYQIIMCLGTIHLGKKLFKENKSIILFTSLICVIPFMNKSTFNYTVESFALSLFPWFLFYLLNYFDKNKIKDLIKFSIIFGFFASNKMNHLLPGLAIIFFLISCFFIKNKFINYKLIFLPILSTSILLIISYILQDGWIWNNSDIRNSGKGYGDIPVFSIFYTVNIIDAFNNALSPQQNYSMINQWLIDFFGDYYSSFTKSWVNPNYSQSFALKINKIGLLSGIIFFIWFFLSFINLFIRNKFDLFNRLNLQLSLLSFLIFPFYICYSFFVFNEATTNSFDLRYTGYLGYFIIYPLIYQLEIRDNVLMKNITQVLSIFFILVSLGLLISFHYINY